MVGDLCAMNRETEKEGRAMKRTKCLLALMMTVFAGFFFTAQLHAKEPIKIGVIQPLTGSVAYDGQSWVHGAQIAEREINAVGGVLGRPIKLFIEDGRCNPAASVSAAEKLITSEKVPVIAGSFCSSATKAVMPVAERNKIPLVTGVSSAPDLTKVLHPYFFRACPEESMYSPTFANHMVKKMGLKTLVSIAVNDDWGRGTTETMVHEFTSIGGKVLEELYFEHGETDYSPFLTKIKAMNPDAVFLAAETQDGSMLVRQYRQLGLKSVLTAVGSLATGTFIKLAGDAANGIYVIAPYSYTAETPGNARFVNAYRKEAKEDPGKYSLAGYDVTHIIAEAIGRAGSTDPNEIRNALEKTDYVGVVGWYEFDNKHQVHVPLFLVQIQGGIPKVVQVIPTMRTE
jgi:branched-chain amino acid transport system substrate-binding protein